MAHNNMARFVYKLTYKPKNQEYIIERMSRHSVDYSKVSNEVARFGQYFWVCKDKSKLEAHIEILKEERAKNKRCFYGNKEH